MKNITINKFFNNFFFSIKLTTLHSTFNMYNISIQCCCLKKLNTFLEENILIQKCFCLLQTAVFTPQYASMTTVRVSNLVQTPDVIKQLLDKFRVLNKPSEFALFRVLDNGGSENLIKSSSFSSLHRKIPNWHTYYEKKEHSDLFCRLLIEFVVKIILNWKFAKLSVQSLQSTCITSDGWNTTYRY